MNDKNEELRQYGKQNHPIFLNDYSKAGEWWAQNYPALSKSYRNKPIFRLKKEIISRMYELKRYYEKSKQVDKQIYMAQIHYLSKILYLVDLISEV